ncbi:MAG: amidohydrolase family protein [Candidatus Omnitrophica bacterium]|nr:amidohydrolase family protein [Candidatus Omnitrophota bacterium]
MSGIIDFHSHYIPPEIAKNTAFFKNYWSDIEGQLRTMDQNGIERSFLFYPATDAHLNMGGWSNVCRIYNKQISNIVQAYDDRFVGAGILPIDTSKDFLDELKRIKDLDLKILSLASSYDGKYLDDEIFFPVYQFCQDNNLPVHIHPQIINPIGETQVKDPLLTPVLQYMLDVSVCLGKMMMAQVFNKFPDVKFVFAHYGGVVPFLKERFDNTYMMLRKRNFVKDIGRNPSEYFKNLFFDTSGSKSLGALACALEVVSPDCIFFGSDSPANQDVAGSIKMIQSSSITEEDKQSILRKNALNLLLAKA